MPLATSSSREPSTLRTRATVPDVRFVVNADDLGGSTAINEAVFTALEERVISSATLMANGPEFTSAVHTLRWFPDASFGVHLNTMDFEPLTKGASLQPLIDERGEFRRGAVFEVRWTPELVDAVTNEWSVQVERVRDSGVLISHLDSHHHVHTVPQLFVALKRVQRRFGIRRVRTTWNIYDTAHTPSLRLRTKKRFWHLALRNVYRTTTTRAFGDFLMFLRAVQEGVFPRAEWPSTIELMVHPNGVAAESGDEAVALRSGWLESLPCSGRLVSYHAL
jgi:predicted glycoside hydrolase/deacetylase ChbG (UPF0249 family)